MKAAIIHIINPIIHPITHPIIVPIIHSIIHPIIHPFMHAMMHRIIGCIIECIRGCIIGCIITIRPCLEFSKNGHRQAFSDNVFRSRTVHGNSCYNYCTCWPVAHMHVIQLFMTCVCILYYVYMIAI